MKSKRRGRLRLTGHALDALASIFDYSTRQWGRRTAEKYLDELEAGLERLRQRPELIEHLPDLHPAFGFYRVNKHLFACDVRGDTVVVLTIVHASMDIPARLAELQPLLAAEIAMLHQSMHRSGPETT